MGNRGSRPESDDCNSEDDQDSVPPTPVHTEADHDVACDPEFELTGSHLIPRDPDDATCTAGAELEYEPVVVIGDDAPDPYPEGYELTGDPNFPRDADDAIFEMELPEYTSEVCGSEVPFKHVDPYDKDAVTQARTKAGPEPEAFAAAVVSKRAPCVPITEPATYVNNYTPVGVIFDASDCAVDTPPETPFRKKTRKDPVVPDPYDKHAPRQGVLHDGVVPSRWSECCSAPKLKDLPKSDVFQVKYGDHFAFFKTSDAEKVQALLPLHPERAQPSANRDTLIRLRLNLAMSDGTDASDMYAMQKLAGLFHDALELADASVDSADLEACVETWVLEPTRYAPFKDLREAVDFMCLPVEDCRVLGVATKHPYAPAIEPCLGSAVTNVTSSSLQLRSEPVTELKRVSVWNEPAKHTAGARDKLRRPLEIDGSC